jgi:hypothetical protein
MELESASSKAQLSALHRIISSESIMTQKLLPINEQRPPKKIRVPALNMKNLLKVAIILMGQHI